MIRAKKNLYCLASVVFISFFGLALPFPIMAPLFLAETQESLQFTHAFPFSPRFLLGVTLAVYPLGQFIGSPFFGALSDRYGRKPMLIISMFAGGLGYVFSAIAILHHQLWLLLCSRFITGIFESNFPIARAAAADLSPQISKSYSFGLLNAAVTGGYLIGPLLGGILADSETHHWFSTDLPFWMASLMNFIALLVLIIFYKDMDKPSDATPHPTQGATPPMLAKRRLLALMLVSFLITLSFDTFYQFYPMFLVEKWDFDSLLIAAITTALTAGMVFTQALLISPSKRWMSTGKNIMTFGLLYSVLLMCLLIPATPWPIYGLMILMGVSIGLVGTHLPVFVSDEVPNWAQGKVMGQTMSLRFLGDAVICLLGGVVSVFSINYPILIGALFGLVGIAWFSWLFIKYPPQSQVKP